MTGSGVIRRLGSIRNGGLGGVYHRPAHARDPLANPPYTLRACTLRACYLISHVVLCGMSIAK